MPDTPPRSLLRRVPRWAVVAWVVLLVGVLGRVAFASPRSGTVVPIYLNAGLRWLNGEDVYAPAWPHDVYRNPPGVAAFFAPWSYLPEKTAGILWRLLGVSLYLTGLVRWAPTLGADGWSDRRLGLVAFLSALLVIPSFNNGQVNVLLVGCLLHAAVDVDRGRFWRAAAWVAFATFFKIYPLAYGLLACVRHPRFALRLVPMVAVFAAIPFAVQRPDYVKSLHVGFVEFLGVESQFRTILTRWPWDWTIVPRAWLDVEISGGVSKSVSVAAGLLMAALVWFAKRRTPDAAAFTALAAGCVWMTLFGPATENATYTLLAPVVAVLALHRRPVGLVIAVLFALPILRGLFPSSEVVPLRTAQPCGAMLLFLVVAADVFRRKGQSLPMNEARTAVRPGLLSRG